MIAMQTNKHNKRTHTHGDNNCFACNIVIYQGFKLGVTKISNLAVTKAQAEKWKTEMRPLAWALPLPDHTSYPSPPPPLLLLPPLLLYVDALVFKFQVFYPLPSPPLPPSRLLTNEIRYSEISCRLFLKLITAKRKWIRLTQIK